MRDYLDYSPCLVVCKEHGVPQSVIASVRQYVLSVVISIVIFGFLLGVVNNFAHAGGFIAGALIGLVLPPQRQIGGRDLIPLNG